MLHKSDYQKSHPEIHEGMTAYSIDGEKLGKVTDLMEDSLKVEKGFFFPKDFTFRYDDIADIRADSLIINQEERALRDWRSERYEGWNEYDRRNRKEEPRATETRSEAERTEVPLYEERLDTEKVMREKGEATVRKVVHTEVKNVEVPITKEEVVIERKSVEGEGARPGEKAFKEEEIRIPIREEEVKVTKQPYEKERVEVRKEAHTDKKKVKEELRSEEVDIKEEGDVKREKK